MFSSVCIVWDPTCKPAWETDVMMIRVRVSRLINLVSNSCLQAMEYQCKEAQRLADMYREQVIQLEDQLSKIREEGNVGK